MSTAVDVWAGLDIGTTGAKLVLVDRSGVAVAADSRRYPRQVAPDGNPDGVEQHAEDWWSAAVDLFSTLTPGYRVRGIGVTCQAPSLVPVDAAGDPVGPALIWADRRAQPEAAEIAAALTAARTDELDTPGDAYFGTGKLLWLTRNRPGQLDAARNVLATNGFIVRRLTGESSLDRSTATMLQGFARGSADPELARIGVPVDVLADPVPSTAIVGAVSATAAAATGLAAGIPVAAGGIDAIGTALEAGCLLPGDPFAEMTGFSTVGMVPVRAGLPAPGLIRTSHCFDDVELLLTAQVTAGAVIDWVVGLTGGDRSILEAAALQDVPRPGALRMLTSLAGERTPGWNPSVRGLLGGIGLDTAPADLVVAAMEGVAVALSQDLRMLADQGMAVDLVRSTGGGSASEVWLQIKADVLGIPVERPEAGSGAAHGAALLAGLAIGDIAGPDEIRSLTTGPVQRFESDPVLHRRYRDRVAEYEALRKTAVSLTPIRPGAGPPR